MAKTHESAKAKAPTATTRKKGGVAGGAHSRAAPLSNIRIACTGSDMLPLDAIEDFQGGLKKRGKKEIEQIITSIMRFGFSFPFYVWNGSGHNYCLDGHGRIAALSELRRRGENLPTFPVVYIDAKDEAEAKQKLLRLNSQYGIMTMDSVLEFAGELSLDGAELSLPGIELVNVSEKDKADQEDEIQNLDRPYEQIHILLSMPVDAFMKHADIFKKLKDLSEVEYEQSKN